MERNLLLSLLCLSLVGSTVIATQSCDKTDTEIRCSAKGLTSVPKVSFHNGIELLDASQNELEELFGVDFSEYTSLITLFLNENSISYIEDDTFEKVLNLEFVDLSRNLLEEIPDNIIINNKRLTVLDLSENLFQSQTPTLTSESLEVLDLSQCKLSRFSNESIENLPNLRLLYLNSNNLITLDDRMFSMAKFFYYVRVDFNPWECTCNTVKMLQRLTDKKLFEITQPVTCVDNNKSHVHIYDSAGPKMCKTKRKVQQQETPANDVEIEVHVEGVNPKDTFADDNEQITSGIKYLEEILKNEKIYFQELKNEKSLLDSVTVWTVKIFILVIFFSGIGLGILISTLMSRRMRRVRSRSLLKAGSVTI